MEQVPLIGVGVRILRYSEIPRDDEVLMGLRKGSHGAGTWSPSGGGLKLGESFEECAVREVYEETGLKIRSGKVLGVTNDIFSEEDLHYVTVFVNGIYRGGEPRACEPEKCVEWRWFRRDNLSEDLFLPVKNFINGGYDLFRR